MATLGKIDIQRDKDCFYMISFDIEKPAKTPAFRMIGFQHDEPIVVPQHLTVSQAMCRLCVQRPYITDD